MRTNPERIVATQVAQYLSLQYPKTIRRFDLAADMNLTPGQAARHKALNPHRGYPDLFIAEIKRDVQGNVLYAGMYLELKEPNVRLFLKDGKTLRKNEHIAEQRAVLDKLYELGYYANFAIGFDECKRLIDWYLKPEKEFLKEYQHGTLTANTSNPFNIYYRVTTKDNEEF